MKKALLTALAAATLCVAGAQTPITITAADMPVNGDTLRWSAASPLLPAGYSFNTTGANTTWNFSALVAIAQGVDHYQTAAQVNIAYALLIAPTAYGYKVADSLPGLGGVLPVSVKDLYTFYNKKTSPSRFVAEGFGATISGFPAPAAYSDEDEVYIFPKTFGSAADSTTFKLSASLAGLGSFSQQGYRKTTVDGWGTIQTPFTTSPVSVIRVRSELVEVDSITFSGISIPLPRNTVEYKWLANGQHYPMMWMTTNKVGGNETVSSVRYRDSNRGLAVAQISGGMTALSVYPSPASGGLLHIDMPAGIKTFKLTMWDASGRLVQSAENVRTMDVSALPQGQYLLHAESGDWQGFARVAR